MSGTGDSWTLEANKRRRFFCTCALVFTTVFLTILVFLEAQDKKIPSEMKTYRLLDSNQRDWEIPGPWSDIIPLKDETCKKGKKTRNCMIGKVENTHLQTFENTRLTYLQGIKSAVGCYGSHGIKNLPVWATSSTNKNHRWSFALYLDTLQKNAGHTEPDSICNCIDDIGAVMFKDSITRPTTLDGFNEINYAALAFWNDIGEEAPSDNTTVVFNSKQSDLESKVAKARALNFFYTDTSDTKWQEDVFQFCRRQASDNYALNKEHDIHGTRLRQSGIFFLLAYLCAVAIDLVDTRIKKKQPVPRRGQHFDREEESKETFAALYQSNTPWMFFVIVFEFLALIWVLAEAGTPFYNIINGIIFSLSVWTVGFLFMNQETPGLKLAYNSILQDLALIGAIFNLSTGVLVTMGVQNTDNLHTMTLLFVAVGFLQMLSNVTHVLIQPKEEDVFKQVYAPVYPDFPPRVEVQEESKTRVEAKYTPIALSDATFTSNARIPDFEEYDAPNTTFYLYDKFVQQIVNFRLVAFFLIIGLLFGTTMYVNDSYYPEHSDVASSRFDTDVRLIWDIEYIAVATSIFFLVVGFDVIHEFANFGVLPVKVQAKPNMEGIYGLKEEKAPSMNDRKIKKRIEYKDKPAVQIVVVMITAFLFLTINIVKLSYFSHAHTHYPTGYLQTPMPASQ